MWSKTCLDQGYALGCVTSKGCQESDCGFFITLLTAEQAIRLQQPHRVSIFRWAGAVISLGACFIIVQSVFSRLVQGLLSTTSGRLSPIRGHWMLRGIWDLPVAVQSCLHSRRCMQADHWLEALLAWHRRPAQHQECTGSVLQKVVALSHVWGDERGWLMLGNTPLTK